MEKLFRPRELVEYDVLRHEMRLGLVSYVPQWAVIPYVVLWAYAGDRRGIGQECLDAIVWNNNHPLKWLCSVIRLHGGGSHWPTLVSTAYEELRDGPLFEPL